MSSGGLSADLKSSFSFSHALRDCPRNTQDRGERRENGLRRRTLFSASSALSAFQSLRFLARIRVIRGHSRGNCRLAKIFFPCIPCVPWTVHRTQDIAWERAGLSWRQIGGGFGDWRLGCATEVWRLQLPDGNLAISATS